MNRIRTLLLIAGGTFLPALQALAASEERAREYMFATILVWVSIIGGLSLLGLIYLGFQYRRYYRRKMSFFKYLIRNAVVQSFGVALLLILGVNTLVPKPDFGDAEAIINYARARNQPRMAQVGYKMLVDQDPENLDLQFKWLASHYGGESWGVRNQEVVEYFDYGTYPLDYYEKLFFSADPADWDLGHWGLGISHFFTYSFKSALAEFDRIENREMKYLNYFLGRLYVEPNNPNRDLETGKEFLRKEAALDGFKTGAYKILTAILYNQRKTPNAREELEALVDNPESRQWLPNFPRRYVYFKGGKVVPYMETVVEWRFSNVHLIGVLGALLGVLAWMIFLRSLNVFQPTRWLQMGIAFLVGALFTFLDAPLYDLLNIGFEFNLNGEPGNDFLYCIFGIGLVEELTKLLAFLFLLKFTNFMKAPLDYLVYACLCALGFSFMENLVYFDSSSVSLIHGRVLTASVGHMFNTALAAYGLILGRFIYRRRPMEYLFLFFLIGVAVHGIYDFWLVNPVVAGGAFLSVLIIIFSTFALGIFFNNALNHSPNFSYQVSLDTSHLSRRLFLLLMGILFFEYVSMAFAYTPEIANVSLSRSLAGGSYLMVFIVLNMGNIDIVQLEWRSLAFWDFRIRGNYNKALGERFEFKTWLRDKAYPFKEPISGTVRARYKIGKNNRYYLVELDTPVLYGNKLLPHLLIKPYYGGEAIYPETRNVVSLVMFDNLAYLLRKKKKPSDFRKIGYALAE